MLPDHALAPWPSKVATLPGRHESAPRQANSIAVKHATDNTRTAATLLDT